MEDENTFKIILSTDNHLGYNEKDPIRGNDSFITFEEILSISKRHQPDFVLLGGDLFHENKPSISSLFKCSQLLRKYCYNENTVKFKIISDQAINFSHNEHFNYSNFNDENINIGMPIFTIHGNHDDPIDQSNLCALDIFHSSGLVNLFGKTTSVESIIIYPVLLQRGTTKIALYGLGAIRNERLHRLFEQQKVSFYRPAEHSDDWFSIFVIHQNRVKHAAKNYIPETFIPAYIDLVIWGHEHDCRIDPEFNPTQKFYVCQPGSSVATSLCEGEAMRKYIGLIEVKGKEFKISKIELKTVRPFAVKSIILEDEADYLSFDDPQIDRKVEQFCHRKMEEILSEIPPLISGHPLQPILPLIRLTVDYSGGFEMFSTMRFSQQYVDKIANPKDLLVLHRKREQRYKEKGARINNELDNNNVNQDFGSDANRVEDLVREHFVKRNEKLSILNEKELRNGVKKSVDKDNKDLLSAVVKFQIDRTIKHLQRNQVNEDRIFDEIQRLIESLELLQDDDDDDDDFDVDGDDIGHSIPATTPSNSKMKETNKSKPIKKSRAKAVPNRIQLSSISTVASPDCSSVNSESLDSNFSGIADVFRKRKLKEADGKEKRSRKN